MDNKPSLHYYFIYKSLRSLVLADYDLFKKMVNYGPEIFTDRLVKVWKDIEKDNPNTFTHTELPEKKPFGLGFVTEQGENPQIFYIEPPLATIAPEAVGVAIVMFENYARFFTLEFSISHIEMQKKGAPPEYCQPSFVVGETNLEGKHFNYGNVKNSSEFIPLIRKILNDDPNN